LSQDDLAYEAGISRSYLSQLEKGTLYASLKIVGKVADVLKIEPAELCGGTSATNRRNLDRQRVNTRRIMVRVRRDYAISEKSST
jgi:transcriptional regulator with XRE-family HTH domain